MITIASEQNSHKPRIPFLDPEIMPFSSKIGDSSSYMKGTFFFVGKMKHRSSFLHHNLTHLVGQSKKKGQKVNLESMEHPFAFLEKVKNHKNKTHFV